MPPSALGNGRAATVPSGRPPEWETATSRPHELADLIKPALEPVQPGECSLELMPGLDSRVERHGQENFFGRGVVSGVDQVGGASRQALP